MLAAASDGVILAFNVRPVGDARAIAEREGVEIRSYAVIYRAIEELRAAMQGMLEPAEVETTLAQAEVRQLFRASRIGTIAGSFVTEGKVTRGASPACTRALTGGGRAGRGGRMSSGRMRRVDEAIRQVIGDAVAGEVKDPRVGFVTVTDVRTSADLRHARVYVSVLGDAEQRR